MERIVFISYLTLSLGFFAYTTKKILSYFKLTKSHGYKVTDNIGERVIHTLLVAFGQSKILKKPISGLLHALVYWGFLVITIGTVEMMIDGVFGIERSLSCLGNCYSIITSSGEIFAALILVSCVIFLIRRYVTKPKRFEAPEMKPASRMDATFILAMIMLLMFSLIGMNLGYIKQGGVEGSFPVSKVMTGIIQSSDWHVFERINWWIHIGLVLLFMNILPYSKHFHVILAIPNVFLDRRGPKGHINNMESVTKEVKLMMDPNAAFAAPPEGAEQSVPERFGIKDVEDISWKTLMDSYTCTECGRCTDVCPANMTGKLLSPRKLYIDTRARMKEKGDALIKDSNYTDGKSLVGDFITEEELWGCTTCGACMEACPVDINHVPHIIDMRRSLVMEESKAPIQINQMFSNIENNGAPWQFSVADRMNWAEDLYINK